jgi:hypothetical protein
MAQAYRPYGPACTAGRNDCGVHDVRSDCRAPHSVVVKAAVNHSPFGRSNYDVVESPYAVYSSRGQ